MDKEAIIKKLNKATGRPGAIAKALIAYDNANYRNKEAKIDELIDLLKNGSPKNLSELFNNGPKQLFELVHGKAAADWAASAAGRLNLYVYSQSVWRRSFRSKNINPYMQRVIQILDSIFFSWDSFDILTDLKRTPDTQYDSPFSSVYADFLAVCIDDGKKEIIEAVKEIILGDNNTKLLSYSIINGIIKSANKELYELLGRLLLAAKLQEGVRQSILENADNGRAEAFIYIIKIVLDNDILRYSSAVRAVDVWMGVGEMYDDKRVTEKLLRLGFEYLNDAKARKAAAKSNDAIEIYASLWAASVFEIDDATAMVESIIKGEKYQKLTALSFLLQAENNDVQTAAAAKLLGETDLDVLSLVMANYNIYYHYWNIDKKDFRNQCARVALFADKKTRNSHFENMLRIISLIPQQGCSSQGKPFPWSSLSLSVRDVLIRMFMIIGYDFDPEKISKLIDIMPSTDPDSRSDFIKLFLDEPKAGKERSFLFAALNDKSMTVRWQALVNISALKLIDGEEENIVSGLLSLKTGDIRQNALKILMSLPNERPVSAAKKLLADKNENKRLAGLDMLTQLLREGKAENAEEFLALMPKVSDKEQVLIDALTAEKPRYSRANGFGLYDPSYVPSFPKPEAGNSHTMKSVFDFQLSRTSAIFDSLCEVIRKNKDYTYKIETYSGGTDAALGTLEWPRSRAEVNDNQELSMFERFVLQDEWRTWIKDNRVTFGEIFVFMFILEVEDYDDKYELDYDKPINKIIESHFNAKQLAKLPAYKKKEYGGLAFSILNILWSEFPESERFAVLYGAIVDLMKSLKEEDWKRDIYAPEEKDDLDYFYSDKDDRSTFADTDEFEFLLEHLNNSSSDDDELFKKYTALCFELGRLSGMFYINLTAPQIARAVELGILKEDALYRTMFLSDARNMNYAGTIQWKGYRDDTEKHPILGRIATESAARVIEIELARGDSQTEVSKLAGTINWHEGADTFAKILVALGQETFVRGYYSSDSTKKSVLSGLLKRCRPKAEDNAGTLREALAGKISDKRLLEAAMYSPSWLDIVGDYLGWPGLKSAAWYFHAHINENFSAQKETEVARYSPISPQDFNDGAFDIEWFRSAYSTLGAERFDLLYDCAKYLTEGSNHRRAQLFADAVLGRLNIEELRKDIHEKRNKDKMLSYSLIPLASDKMKDALARYEFIQSFLKESKSFGAQRRESEAKVCAIAAENLARNAGFSDTLRFTWRMEILKIEQIKSYFEPVSCGAYLVKVDVGAGGIASVVCEKEGKVLASIPSAIKKDPYIEECKAVAASLKAQYKRARENLEKAMVNRDVFEYGEIKALMDHPVVAPLLLQLIFVNGKKAGLFHELKGVKDNSELRIAHPHDLYTLGNWLEYQHYAFENKLVQPFKQIFRELYLINEDELADKTVSRRYAGHQVQPSKTVALLKGRLWTVDYEEGLQRVYYKENIYVKLYAAADWFSPADVEAPTLETVEFFDRKTHKPVQLDAIHPVVFSEVMRDIDLVVSAAHVGGVDPEASHSTVEMRAVIVRELLSLLHISNVEVDGRFAKVQGSLGEYTVHLGSAMVHKMGKGAVNILAVPSQHRGRVFLPFADDDPRTAEVMSKIILLAEDTTIKDPAILSQIK